MRRFVTLPASAIAGICLLTASVALGQKAESASDTASDAGSQAAQSCFKSLLVNFEVVRHDDVVRQVPVWRAASGTSFFFTSGMFIDADGAPNAYHPDDIGLDALSNAGGPEHWDGIVAGVDGIPFIQGPDDPFPGYYVSCTALGDRGKSVADPTRYVDASKIPYIVLPGDVARQAGARLGDFAVVFNSQNGKSSYAIFADMGSIGEGSIALAENLGINSNARRGGAAQGIVYHVFAGSGDGRPRSLDEINTETAKLVQDWGGIGQIGACATTP